MAPWIVRARLSQIGEFSFVLARAGVTSGMLSKAHLRSRSHLYRPHDGPVAARLEPGSAAGTHVAWTPRIRGARRAVEPLTESLRDHVIVAGYGRSGQGGGSRPSPRRHSIRSHRDQPCRLRRPRARWLPRYLGRPNRRRNPKAAHIDAARVLLLTVPDQATVRLAVQRARHLNPGLSVIARAFRQQDVMELRRLGVAGAVQPEFEGGVEMVRQALLQYAPDAGAASDLICEMRSEYYGRPQLP